MVVQFERFVPSGLLSHRRQARGLWDSTCVYLVTMCLWFVDKLFILPIFMSGLNSKTLSLPKEKNETNFVLPVNKGEKPTCISFISTNKVARWEILWFAVTNLTSLRLRAC